MNGNSRGVLCSGGLAVAALRCGSLRSLSLRSDTRPCVKYIILRTSPGTSSASPSILDLISSRRPRSDFWRVEEVQRGHLVRLVAEMRLPGRARLQFEVKPSGSGSLIRQTAIFDPVGVLGQLYWYLLYPLHQLIFAGMLRGVVRAMGE
jgi:Protein of unknown function (DUF2867)